VMAGFSSYRRPNEAIPAAVAGDMSDRPAHDDA
jgi:hypothetical protein